MFGFYRTFLALIVVVHHLLEVPVIGKFAVHGFFILSGYLMTHIVHHTYGYSLNGTWSFAQNRFLRLFPTYWFVLLVSIVILLFIDESYSKLFHSALFIPQTLTQWLQNLSMLFVDLFPNTQNPRISPPTWALTIELFYYLLIGLGISRNKTLTLSWLLLSLFYMASTHMLSLPYPYRYETIFAGSLPFAIGACLYHFRTELLNIFQNAGSGLFVSITTCLLFVNAYLGTIADKSWFDISYYVNYLLNGLLILALMKLKTNQRWQRFDQHVGDYSYPIYLLHWQLGVLVSYLLYRHNEVISSDQHVVVFWGALLLTLGVSYFSINILDKRINLIRQRIRNKIKQDNSDCQTVRVSP